MGNVSEQFIVAKRDVIAQRLVAAFWSAAETIRNDESVHDMEIPYFDKDMGMVDTSGCGMPSKFWEHMATAWMAQGD